MADKPRALFLSPEPPYPVVGGGPLRTASLLEYLTQHFDTDVFTCQQPNHPDPLTLFPAGRFRRTFAFSLPRHRSALPARAVRNLDRLRRGSPPLLDRFQSLGPALSDWIAGQTYEVSVVEHFWCAPHAPRLRPHCRSLILDLHNIESRWHYTCAQNERGPARWAHRRFAAAYRQEERRYLPEYDRVLVTSQTDADQVLQIHPKADVSIYPNSLPDHELPQSPRDEAVAFSGNLEYLPNIQAVRYFRSEIWPALRERFPEMAWRLIGRNPHAVEPWLSGDPRIEMTGSVADAVNELGRARLAVVPLRSGSGTRLKILEAWAAATPVVTTTLGVEGLSGCAGKHWLIAETASEFISQISRLLQDPAEAQRIGLAGRQQFEEHYTWAAAWRVLAASAVLA